MSEEEIIGRLKKIIKIAYSKEFNIFELKYQDVDAIQGLLDLYNKEKEKNTFFYDNQEECLAYINEKGNVTPVQNNYISKDKIRNTIKKIDEEIQYSVRPETIDTYKFTKEVLEKLLEE